MQWQHTLSLLALWFLAHLFSLKLAVSWNAKDFAVKPDLNIAFPWSLSYLWVFVVLALFEVMVSDPLFGISGINLSVSSPHRWNQWKLARSSGPSAAASRTFTWWVFIQLLLFFVYICVVYCISFLLMVLGNTIVNNLDSFSCHCLGNYTTFW